MHCSAQALMWDARLPPARSGRYSEIVVAVHCITSVLALFVLVLGLAIDGFPKNDASAALNVHALAGLAIFLMTVVRLLSK